MEEEFIRSASGDETVTDDKEATIRNLIAENKRLRANADSLFEDVKRADEANKELVVERDSLRAVILRYLEFAKDVAVSPVAPELRPIREAMRAAIADGQPTERATWRANNDHYDGTADGKKDWES